MIQLDSISKAYGGDQLFESLTWKLPDDAVLGLVGANGAGKSTLFRIICGEEEPDRGRVVIPRHVTVGYLPQEVTEVHTGSVLDVILEGAGELLELEDRLAELEIKLEAADGAESEELSHVYGELQERFRRGGGYSIRGKARQIAAGLGFGDDEVDRPMQEFSGGWRMRALVGRLLLSGPDVLLLDEPTNHLDLESLEWLESYLKNYDGTIVIISHDRYFLNRLADQIAELANNTVRSFVGNYDAYLEQRDELRERLQKEREQQEKEIAQIQEFIDRFRYKASKAPQVQSRIKMLEKIELVEVPPDNTPNISFEFPQPPRVGKRVATLDGVRKAYDDNVVFDGLDFTVFRGDKLALVGPNGAGKSTMLKLLAGAIEPNTGTIELGHRVEVSYFAQHSVDQLDLSRTVLGEMEATASTEAFPRIRSVLGAFNFSEADVEKQISVLSGGEKSRLALAKMLLEPAGLLLLDEPTNHLDITSRQMLEQALQKFEGAFCVVSHDRYFLNEIVEKVAHIEAGEITEYDGDYDYYRWKHAQRVPSDDEGAELAADGAGDDASRQLTKKEIRQRSAEIRKRRDAETRELRKKLDKIESEIATVEERHGEIEAQLAKPETYEDGELTSSLNQEFAEVEGRLEELMLEWEEVGAELEKIERRYLKEEAALKQ
ncbi:ABC-F family ATP-binding cassette domain-containing protein [Persicimonas caeni]|uniref:ABC-F family ATP-binding cassette domain-containing protein n=1 Tax=Persicimonas caeni TaxID=2292766 RepID=A0A4Y6Q1T4_PERCE|nr:ABC-F family ATP-binding cassette domain-containing protein [Persicimonas caeni]QDG54526.1 ABC-F family ATP-binding cassette domain-containing protein [Persicimonas caeni]QED35747.1 ABC-F family ATP-binding cassette domain-containing protein [Persicimonas caeni]